jgi:hypothetical protein
VISGAGRGEVLDKEILDEREDFPKRNKNQ